MKSEIYKSRAYPPAPGGKVDHNGKVPLALPAGHYPLDNEHFAQNGDPYVRRALMEAIPGTGVDADAAPAVAASLEQDV